MFWKTALSFKHSVIALLRELVRNFKQAGLQKAGIFQIRVYLVNFPLMICLVLYILCNADLAPLLSKH